MTDRRTVLSAAGLAALGSLAGCLDRGRGNGNGGPPGDGGDDTGVAGYGVAQYLVSSSLPRWRQADDPGRVVVIDSEERAGAVFRDDVPEERRDEVAELIDGIDYDESVLLLIETVGPNTCYNEVDAGNFRVEDGRLRGDAEAVDTSDDDEACGEAVTFPSAVARVDFADERVTDVELSVTDGWDETSVIEATATDPLSPDPADLEGYVRPEAEPEPIAPLECDDEGFERHEPWFDEDDVVYGEFEEDGEPTLALRVAETEYERGDTVEIRLTNVTDRLVDTGNRHRYNLQVYTDDGWQELRGWDGVDPQPLPDDAIRHRPNEGFEWSLALTEAGLVEDHLNTEALTVCPDLPSGRYRFAYHGVIGDAAVAVAFDVA